MIERDELRRQLSDLLLEFRERSSVLTELSAQLVVLGYATSADAVRFVAGHRIPTG